jgi:hypothetical protein
MQTLETPPAVCVTAPRQLGWKCTKVGVLPVDLTARRGAATREDQHAERWLDEGGSYSAAVAAELPAPN